LKKGSLNRADPNFNITITLKQQIKLKDEEWKPAKPPQPVWIHPDHQLFTEGPYGMLLLDLLIEHKPPYWHFHAKETFQSFETWVGQHLDGVEKFEMNDLVGQDQSTQGWAVRVLENLMRWFSFPEHVINEFKNNKLFKTLDGRIFIAIMTDSGEVWTFIINTVSNTARECFMFSIQPGQPMAQGGDDTLKGFVNPINPQYEVFRHMDPCEDKRYVSDRGEFTAHIIKNGVLYKNPIILLKRFLVRLATGRGEEAVLGYFDIFAQNYAKKEELIVVMTEPELEAHNILTRIFMNLRKEGLKLHVDWNKTRNEEYEQLLEQKIIPTSALSAFPILRNMQMFAPVFNDATALNVLNPVSTNALTMNAYTAEF
jgi:hypothetical protein